MFSTPSMIHMTLSSTSFCNCLDFFCCWPDFLKSSHRSERSNKAETVLRFPSGLYNSNADGPGFISLTRRRGAKLIGIFTFCQHCVGSSNTGVKRRMNSFPPTRAAQEKLQRPAQEISAKWIWKDESLICLNFACAVYFHTTFPSSSANSLYFSFHHHFQVQKVPVSPYLCLGE